MPELFRLSKEVNWFTLTRKKMPTLPIKQLRKKEVIGV